MTKIMIFGGCGFIGSHVVDLLHGNKSNKLYIFDDLSTGKMENIRHLISEKHNTRIRFNLMDIKNPVHVQDAFCEFQPEVIVLLAAQASIAKSQDDPAFDMNTNICGMLNVIRFAREAGTRRIVFSSTSAVYREKKWGKLKETDVCDPKSPYGISKLAAENYLRALFPESVILRLGNVYGPRQVPLGNNQVIPRAIHHFEFGDDFQVFGDGKHTRDYVYVGDVADAVEAAIVGRPGTYNIATGRRRSVNEVVDTLAEVYGVKGYKWEHCEAGNMMRDVCLDVRRAEEWLGWKAHTKFSDGIQKTVDWWDPAPSEEFKVKFPKMEVVR